MKYTNPIIILVILIYLILNFKTAFYPNENVEILKNNKEELEEKISKIVKPLVKEVIIEII